MADERTRLDVAAMVRTAERLDVLADTAELMDDLEGAVRLRAQAAGLRDEAMGRLDG